MKKNKNKIILILAIILIMLVIIGLVADARYQTMLSGTGSASIANWSFKLVDADPQTTDIIELAVTRTDGSDKVVEGKMAPGTYGEFEIGIDARGTETVLEYTIDISLENAPRNLIFYADSERTEVLEIANSTVTKAGYMTLEEVNEIRTEKIYWEWPYETGETDSDIITNDEEDTQDAGKDVTMQITVTGTQVLEEPRYLANEVQVGDFVNYNASSNGTKTFTSADCLAGSSISATISTDNSFNSDAVAQWRVLNVDKENGIVELMSTDPTTQIVTLSGVEGFANGEKVLNNIGAIYGYGKGATSARSVVLNDIEQYSSYNPNDYLSYGKTKDYTSGIFYKEIKDNNGNIIGYEESPTEISNGSITMTQTFYAYETKNYLSNSAIYNMITNSSTFWLATKCSLVSDYYCRFAMFVAGNSEKVVSGYGLFNSDGSIIYTPTSSVVPVVTLKSNIQTTGQDENGVWQLDV